MSLKPSKYGLVAADWLPVAMLLCAVVPALLGDDATTALQYARPEIASGEVWRLLSGHFVHLGWQHLFLNGLGLLLVWVLFGRAFNTRHWLIIILASIAVMDLGFWFLLPDLGWYVGLSGLLHGLLAAGIAGSWQSRAMEARLLCVLLIAKLGYELLVGPLPGSVGVAGGAVITEAHLYGALGGLAAGLPISRRVRPPASI